MSIYHFVYLSINVFDKHTLGNRYTKYRWTLRLKTRLIPKDPSTADEYFC